MTAIAEQLYKYTGNNPFTDSQGRQFSDSKIQNEFCPISQFWSLFNDHHEILLGTRGSGKTFLLKMMRRSMIEKINDDKAKDIIDKGEFVSFYVPLHIENVNALQDSQIDNARKIVLFRIMFNCILAESMVEEICFHIDKLDDDKRRSMNIFMAERLAQNWLPDCQEEIMDLMDLQTYIRKMFYQFDYIHGDLSTIPVVFSRDIAAPLLVAQPVVSDKLGFSRDVTWIICVDEAEFIPALFQKCLNSFMRSNTDHVALKIATLPYYWTTLETLNDSISISPENDFNYQILDMDCESEDFKNLTNKLCAERIKKRVNADWKISSLEDFLGVVGDDHRIDYYRYNVGEVRSTKEEIISDIIASFSPTRQKSADGYNNPEKTIHQKFAPILYVREIYKMNRERGQGAFVPGWYAGAEIVRKIAQGNPRLFIRLMSSMFNAATKKRFSPKVQHQVIEKFVYEFCESSNAIEEYGPEIHDKLEKTGMYLQNKVHKGYLISVGCSFKYKYVFKGDFAEWKKWIQRAVAFSKVIVSDEEIKNGISEDSVIILSNAYAAYYWLPMRKDYPLMISTNFQDNEKKINLEMFGEEEEGGQLSFIANSDDEN